MNGGARDGGLHTRSTFRLAVCYGRGIIAELRPPTTEREVVMPRRPRTVGVESALDLARKAEILEREMATQREALERLKQMGTSRQIDGEDE